MGRAAGKKRLTFARHGGPRPDGSSWTADLARDEALRLLGSIKAGGDPLAERAAAKARAEAAAADSLGAAVRRWLETDQKDNRRRGEVERMLRKDVLPCWGERPLAAIRKRDVIELVERVHARAPVGANRLLGSLQRFFKWAAARDLIEASPAAAVEKPGRETTRGRVLTDGELVEIWRAAERMGAPYGTGIRLLILTAARRGEIFRARRDELEIAGGRLLLPAERSKNDEARSVWLPPLALDMIDELPKFAGSPWLLTAQGEHPCTNHGYNRRRLDALILEARRAEAASGASRRGPSRCRSGGSTTCGARRPPACSGWGSGWRRSRPRSGTSRGRARASSGSTSGTASTRRPARRSSAGASTCGRCWAVVVAGRWFRCAGMGSTAELG